MNTIIVPLDFSNESYAGLKMSLMLAEKIGSEIEMVHVIGRNISSDSELLGRVNQLAKMKFEEIIQECKSRVKQNCVINYTIKEGKIFKEITSLAEMFYNPLTVLSTHGESGFEELFIGGNAYKIISHSRNPVMTIRKNKIPLNINTIVMPLDITLQTREKVSYTMMLAKIFNSEIHLITVRLSKIKSIERKLHQYTEQVGSYLDSHDVPFVIEHLQGRNLEDLTLDYALSEDADLISIMTEQERNVSNLLLGSYAHQLINKATIPVLTFPTFHLGFTDDFSPSGVYHT